MNGLKAFQPLIDMLMALGPFVSVPLLIAYGLVLLYIIGQVAKLKDERVNVAKEIASLREEQVKRLQTEVESLRGQAPDPSRLLSEVEIIRTAARERADQARRTVDEVLTRLGAKEQEVELIRQAHDFLVRDRGTTLETMAHAILGPLVGIRGHAELLQRLAAEGHLETSLIQRHTTDIATMSEYIALLLEGTTVLNAEAQEYRHDRVGLHALAAKWCRLLQPLADQSRMSLTLRGQAPNWPLLFVDKRKVELALFHLLTNAINYGQTGSDVLVEGVSEPGGFCLVVSNWGIAIPKESERIIFAGGYRSREAMAKSPIGQGMGLVIVNRVLQAHGGKVLLRRADGSPAQFVLWFPDSLANAPTTR